MGFEKFFKKTIAEDNNQLDYDNNEPKVYTKEEERVRQMHFADDEDGATRLYTREEIDLMSPAGKEMLKEAQELEEKEWRETEKKLKEEKGLEFEEKRIGFFKGRELKKTKNILNKRMKSNNKQDKLDIEETKQRGGKINEKMEIRTEGYEELEKDEDSGEIDLEKTFKRLNEEKNSESKDKVYECLSRADASMSLDMEREWRGKTKGLTALLDTENKSVAEKKELYIKAYLKEVPFTKEEDDEKRQMILNYLNNHAERKMNLGSVKIRKEIIKENEDYKKETERMLRLRELINKKYFRGDEKKQNEIDEWRKDDEELMKR